MKPTRSIQTDWKRRCGLGLDGRHSRRLEVSFWRDLPAVSTGGVGIWTRSARWYTFTLREWHLERDALVSFRRPDYDCAPTAARVVCKAEERRTGGVAFFDAIRTNGNTHPNTKITSVHRGRLGHTDMVRAARRCGRIIAHVLLGPSRRRDHLSYREAPFTWLFSSDAGAVVTKPEPACINQSGSEGGLATRIMYSNAQIKQAGIVINARLGLLRFADPGGFLGALEAPPVVGQTPVDLRSTFNTCLSDLSDALALGQAWHGWAYTSGIETAYGIKYPAGYSIGGDASG